MKDIQVVVYGASGYTGEHIMWKLAERGIAFIAAGRNKQRLEQRISQQAELKETRYEVVQVEHDEAAARCSQSLVSPQPSLSLGTVLLLKPPAQPAAQARWPPPALHASAARPSPLRPAGTR